MRVALPQPREKNNRCSVFAYGGNEVAYGYEMEAVDKPILQLMESKVRSKAIFRSNRSNTLSSTIMARNEWQNGSSLCNA